ADARAGARASAGRRDRRGSSRAAGSRSSVPGSRSRDASAYQYPILPPMGDDVGRLENLWGGEFGDSYVERNREAAEGREPYWRGHFERHPFASVLEVGCNVGGNLHWLERLVEPEHVFGVDINLTALREVRASLPGVNALYSPARSLPFR